jgi:hypothetical protein
MLVMLVEAPPSDESLGFASDVSPQLKLDSDNAANTVTTGSFIKSFLG